MRKTRQNEPADMQLLTKRKYQIGEATSALIKCLRRGNEELALFFGLELEETFTNHFWKRLAIFCTEDVGLADPDAIVRVNALWDSHARIKEAQGKGREVEQDIAVMAILYLCRAPKAREVDTAKNWAMERRAKGFKPEVPDYALDCHTQRGKQAGKTELDWWLDDAWLPEGGYGKYEHYARLKQQQGELPPERK